MNKKEILQKFGERIAKNTSFPPVVIFSMVNHLEHVLSAEKGATTNEVQSVDKSDHPVGDEQKNEPVCGKTQQDCKDFQR